METEVKDRAKLAKQSGKAEGYSQLQHQGGMVYEQQPQGYPQQPPVAHQHTGHTQPPHQQYDQHALPPKY